MEVDNGTPSSNGTPVSHSYGLRTRTPATPVNHSTPVKTATSRLIKKESSTPNGWTEGTPESPGVKLRSGITLGSGATSRATNGSTPSTPTSTRQRLLRSKVTTPQTEDGPKFQSPLVAKVMTPQKEDGLKFQTPMVFKPRMVGNKHVPSPSRSEIWKEQLGLNDDPSGTSDKENSSSDEEEGQKCQASIVEFRALQRELDEKNTQRDEILLQVKTQKDKVRLYKSRLEREETTKRQQLKIMRNKHEEKDQLIQKLQSMIEGREERIRELEEATDTGDTSPRKKSKQIAESKQPEPTGELIEQIRTLQSEKGDIATQLSEVQFELATVRDDTSQEIASLKDVVVELERRIKDETKKVSCACSALEAERDKLQKELSDLKYANNKAHTLSKLNSHRHEQLEEELKRSRTRIGQLEKELHVKEEQWVGQEAGHQKLAATHTTENLQLQDKTRELQAQIFELHSKSPEVVKVTKVKEVESESLKKLYNASKTEISQLTLSNNEKKEELLAAKTQIKYLERMLEHTQGQKVEADNQVWTELQSLNDEHEQIVGKLHAQFDTKTANLHAEHEEIVGKLHKEFDAKTASLSDEHEEIVGTIHKEFDTKTASLNDEHEKMLGKLHEQFDKKTASLHTEHEENVRKLREEFDVEKQNEIKMMENRLVYEHKKELHGFKESLNSEQQVKISELANSEQVLRTTHASELSRLKEELTHQLSLVEENKNKLVSKMEEEMQSKLSCKEEEKVLMKRKHASDIKKLEEDLTISKTVAITKLREDHSRDLDKGLKLLQEQLTSQHDEEITKLQQDHQEELESWVERVRQEMAGRITQLEACNKALVDKVDGVNTSHAALVKAYRRLQTDAKQFPRMIQMAVSEAGRETLSAIAGISAYNQELVAKYQREMKLRKKYHNELVELRGNIRVFCRVRPVIKEDGHGQMADQIISLDADDDGVISVTSKGRTQTFEVDKVFSETSTQQQIFDEVKALVTCCIDGFNVCIFAYGQTGSGKTYTMEGSTTDPGINQRALGQLFAETAARGSDWQYTITVSVLEIYNEMIRDLLSDDTSYKMEVKINPEGGGLHIPGLSYITVASVSDVNQCFRTGQGNRATAATNLNEHSSRSHCLLCVTVVGVNNTTGVKTTGKLNLVDLAGSERVSKSKADGARLKEAQSINKSLSCIGDVIYALRSKQSYVPYRNSKLTYLLQDSLGGDSKTLMITQVAPVKKNEGETICSLNFAQRVRNVELGAATRKLENGEMVEVDALLSPARGVSTPQRLNPTLKQSTPSSNSKLTPLSRQQRKK